MDKSKNRASVFLAECLKDINVIMYLHSQLVGKLTLGNRLSVLSLPTLAAGAGMALLLFSLSSSAPKFKRSVASRPTFTSCRPRLSQANFNIAKIVVLKWLANPYLADRETLQLFTCTSPPPPPPMGPGLVKPAFKPCGRSTGQRSQFTCPVYISAYCP